ncbi:serine hydrolase domain-containing protein [Chloroflexota bacterium]
MNRPSGERKTLPHLDPSRLDKAYSFLEECVQTGKIPGAAILAARYGVPLKTRCFGRMHPYPDSPSVQPDTIFQVASVTKPVTVTAAMLLVERGKLLLDQTVASIIPEFGNQGEENIQIRHLMTHTSGLPDHLPENIELRKQHAPLKEFIRRICDVRPDFPPGTNIQYQSCGFAILGEIIERVGRVSLPDFLRREVFRPLGMKDTALGAQSLPEGRISCVNVGEALQEADWWWNSSYWWHLGAPWGGMFSTVGDIFRFCQMFLNDGELNGVRVLSPATVRMMTTDQIAPMSAISQSGKRGRWWGLGWRLYPARGWSYLGDRLSPGSYGHGGDTGVVAWVDPVREIVCVLFTNQPSASSEKILGRGSNLVAASAL